MEITLALKVIETTSSNGCQPWTEAFPSWKTTLNPNCGYALEGKHRRRLELSWWARTVARWESTNGPYFTFRNGNAFPSSISTGSECDALLWLLWRHWYGGRFHEWNREHTYTHTRSHVHVAFLAMPVPIASASSYRSGMSIISMWCILLADDTILGFKKGANVLD